MPEWGKVKLLLEEAYKQKSHLFIDIPEGFYDDIKNHVELVITGEEVDVPAKLATYSTLYQSLVQVGDPRSEQVLKKIMSLTGENLEAAIGTAQGQMMNPTQPMQAPSFSAPQQTNQERV
jgi:hypothetical protein